MFYQVLSEMAKISGLTAFISVLLGYILGIHVLLKYIKTKQLLILNFFTLTYQKKKDFSISIIKWTNYSQIYLSSVRNYPNEQGGNIWRYLRPDT